VADDQQGVVDVTPPAARRRAGQHARATLRRLAHWAIVKLVAAFSLLLLAIALRGFGWGTCAIEVAVVFCIVMIDRTASALVDRWGRGAAGEELVGEALDSLRDRGMSTGRCTLSAQGGRGCDGEGARCGCHQSPLSFV
jgi:hypothetical protein